MSGDCRSGEAGLAPVNPPGLREGFRAIWRFTASGLLLEGVALIWVGLSLGFPSVGLLAVTTTLLLPAIIFFVVWWLHLLYVLVIQNSEATSDPRRRSWKVRALLGSGLLMSVGFVSFLGPVSLTWAAELFMPRYWR